jgi:3-keto steroid reductase
LNTTLYHVQSCPTHYHCDRCKQVRSGSLHPPSRVYHSAAHRFPRADSGVGFGICRRLLHAILQNNPDDAHPLFPPSAAEEPGVEYPCTGLTLIMACRNRQRADAARAKLLELFEDDVAFYLRKGSKSDGGGAQRRVEAFRANLVVAVHLLDLASVRSTLAFADEVART